MSNSTGKNNSSASFICSLCMNLAVFVLGTAGTVMCLVSDGIGMLQFYTVLSNIIASLSCLVLALFSIRRRICGKEIPRAVMLLKFTSVCCLSVTFLVVVFVIIPMSGNPARFLLQGYMLFHHLLCPILAFLSFVLFDSLPMSPRRSVAYAMLPTFLYAAVVIILNLTHTITGPYPFMRVYEQPWWLSLIWFVLILGGAYLSAFLLSLTKRRKA